MFSNLSLFTLNNTNKATPLPVKSPAKEDPSVIAPFKYNSVQATLAPQLGINPTKLVINGLKKLFFKNNSESFSSPK